MFYNCCSGYIVIVHCIHSTYAYLLSAWFLCLSCRSSVYLSVYVFSVVFKNHVVMSASVVNADRIIQSSWTCVNAGLRAVAACTKRTADASWTGSVPPLCLANLRCAQRKLPAANVERVRSQHGRAYQQQRREVSLSGSFSPILN